MKVTRRRSQKPRLKYSKVNLSFILLYPGVVLAGSVGVKLQICYMCTELQPSVCHVATALYSVAACRYQQLCTLFRIMGSFPVSCVTKLLRNLLFHPELTRRSEIIQLYGEHEYLQKENTQNIQSEKHQRNNIIK